MNLFFSKRSKFGLVVVGSALTTLGLLATAYLLFRAPNPALRLTLLGLLIILVLLNLYLAYYVITQIYRPLTVLVRETEETLQGLRQGDISLVRDDEIGLLANNFNQIILEAQMKRMELETSNIELQSHAEIIERTYRELDKKVYDLFTLFNIGKELNSTLSKDAILKITCFTSLGQLGITNMTIMLLENRDTTLLQTVFEKGVRDRSVQMQSLECGEAFMNLMHLTEQPVLLPELQDKPEYARELEFFSGIKVWMIAPLTVKKTVIGLMLMGRKLSQEDFGQGEKDFVMTLGSIAAIALENARLYELAITDAMTKLYLKRYFQLRLDDELRRAERYKGKVVLIMMDIDHFKRINDTFGHTKGDEVLIAVAKAIRENFRDVDIPARYGGEEFCAILPEVTKEDAFNAAERLRKNVEKVPHHLGRDGETIVTISIGIAEFPRDAKSGLQLIEAADAALYRSKEAGRNRTTLA